MRRKNIKFAGIVLILLFALNTFGVIFNNGGIPDNNHKKSGKNPEIDTFNDEDDEIFDENTIIEESPKTASGIELEQDYDFSFNTTIQETWNTSYSYSRILSDQFFNQPDPRGYDVSFQFNITNLRNSTNDLVDVGDFGGIQLMFWNFSKQGPDIFVISDAPGLGNATAEGNIYVNETMGSWFQVNSAPACTFNATMYFNALRTQNVTTEFLPDTENTDSDLITWDLNFQPLITVEGNYSANLNIENYSDFTLKSVTGKLGGYWQPISYSETATGILLNEYYDEYSIKLTTPNYVSILYNANLTFINQFTGKGTPDDYELRLYITCQAAGNLTIYFKNSTNEVTRISQMVPKDEIVFYNYIMNQTTPGGLGSLEISLINKSDKINFGVKTAEIMFYKNALIDGHTSNTSAFTDFFILAAYFDLDKLGWFFYLNGTGQISLTQDQMFNQSSIPNATVTYDLEGLAGELDYGLIPGINLTLYNLLVDLKEFQIVPGEYNLTFRGSKPGYATLEFVDQIVIYKQNVTVIIGFTPADKIIEVEENLAISVTFMVSVSYPPYSENFLRVPVNLSWEIIKDGELDDKFEIPSIIQAYIIQGQMENDSLPGEYILNFTIISEYYQGNISINVTVIKKPLEISVDYSGIITESINKNFTWDLEAGDFNKENMTVDILIDDVFIKNVSLASNSSGYNLFSFTPGVHNITYRLISPFYTAEETIEFTVQAKTILAIPDDDDDDDDDNEENILLLLIITLILIGVSILAIFMVISRHKVKAQRELESELIALKTKTTATEQKISLIETQISEIVSIYWVLVVHSEQGVTMIEIADFKFENVIGEEHKELIGKGTIRDSALIGGFLTAIRNFARETSGTSLEYQSVFNSQTDYSTVVEDNEIHRRILEGTYYFMAFVSSRGTMEISDVLSIINSKFELVYGQAVKKFDGAISPFRPFEEEVVTYLHKEIKELQKKLSEERLVLEQHERHLREVQEKIGIKPKKLK